MLSNYGVIYKTQHFSNYDLRYKAFSTTKTKYTSKHLLLPFAFIGFFGFLLGYDLGPG